LGKVDEKKEEEEEDEDVVIDEETFVSTGNNRAIDQAKTFYPRVMWEREGTPTFDAIIAQ